MSEPFDTAKQNLSLWHETAAQARELCLLQQTQLGSWVATKQATEESSSPKDAFIGVGELQASPLVPPAKLLAHTLNVEERIAFCRGILQASPNMPTAELIEESPPAAPLICFLDSFFSREAMRRFDTVLPMARPLTAPTLTEVCEELASRHADFALLPIEDSREGRFWHLFEEIERFELRLCMTCEIPYPDEGRSVTVALLSRRPYALPRSALDRLWSLTLFDEDPHSLIDLLQASLSLGITLTRIDSLPAPYGDGGVFYHPVFRVKEEAEALFEAYLNTFHPRARITAKYTSLK